MKKNKNIEIARRINEAHAEAGGNLAHQCNPGVMLLEQLEKLGGKAFKLWVKEYISFGEEQVSKYMIWTADECNGLHQTMKTSRSS